MKKYSPKSREEKFNNLCKHFSSYPIELQLFYLPSILETKYAKLIDNEYIVDHLETGPLLPDGLSHSFYTLGVYRNAFLESGLGNAIYTIDEKYTESWNRLAELCGLKLNWNKVLK